MKRSRAGGTIHLSLFITVLLTCISVQAALAGIGDGGYTVQRGSADIVAPGGNANASINLLTPSAVIGWQNFNTIVGQSVTFDRDGMSYAVLNRIGAGPTRFNGSLYSNNGLVILTNPSGVLFEPWPFVQARSFAAVGFDVNPTDFMAEGENFDPLDFGYEGYSSNIELNRTFSGGSLYWATIDVDDTLALIGRNITNKGRIYTTQPDAYVLMAAGETLLFSRQNGTISAEVVAPVPADFVVDNGGNLGTVSGRIYADGGHVILVGGNIYSTAVEDACSLYVNATGDVQLNGTISATGDIKLVAGGTISIYEDVVAGGNIFIDCNCLQLYGNLNAGGTITIIDNCTNTFYVDNDALSDLGPNDPCISDPFEDGSIEHPYDAIQEAIDTAYEGGTIIVLPGTYTGPGNRDIDYLGKAITVRSTDPNDPCVVSTTIVDCYRFPDYSNHRGFYFHNGEGSDSILDGLTIKRGLFYYENGGGILCEDAGPTIKRCLITGNWGSSNSYNGGGGGIFGSSGPILQCTITGNRTGGSGGGLANCSGLVSECVISNNSSSLYGGGLWDCGSIKNCVISSNGCTNYGGGITNCNGLIMNCTIFGNSANYGGAMMDCGGEINGCIIWGNITGHLFGPLNNCSVPTYSCIQDWTSGGEGNINSDPCFVDSSNGDYHLLPISLCIDAGPLVQLLPGATDLDGNPRIIGPRIDMGAYEYQGIFLSDLEITSEDINFVPVPGGPCEPVTISATIWNIGEATAENVLVVFKDFDNIIGDVNIQSIQPGDPCIISIQRTWSEAGFHMISVTVDPYNEITELDEDNNYAAKLYQVGEKPGPGVSIELSVSAPTGFAKCRTASISGTANYRIPITGQPDYEYPVKGGSVSVGIFDSNGIEQDTQQLFTNTTGYFRAYFDVPGDVNDVFDVNVIVTDGTFSETWQGRFDVLACRDIYLYSSDISFSDDNPDVNETVTVSAMIHAASDNTYTEPNVPVIFYAYPPTGGKYQIGQTQYTGQMPPGAGKLASVDANFPDEGAYYIQVVLEPDFWDDNNANNRAGRTVIVGPPIPPPLLTVSANPKYNVHKGDMIHVTVDAREPLPSDELDSITIKDSANRDIPFLPSDPCHPTPTQWLYEINSLPQDTAIGTAWIYVTGTDSNYVTHNAQGYFNVTELPVDLWVHSDDIGFSENNPDINETITIDALIHTSPSNAEPELNIPVTFYANLTGQTYKIGQTQYIDEIPPGGAWLVSTTWRNAAEGGYIIEAILGPGYSDDNNSNNKATRALVVGDFPFIAYFAEPNKVQRIGRTEFRYESKVTLFNNSDVAIEDVQLELVSVPNNMTIIDPYVTYGSIGAWGSDTSTDICVFDVNRAEELEECEIIWRAVYTVAGTGERLQQVFSNCSPLPPIISPCDFTGEGVVDIEDLAILADQWLQAPGIPSADIAPPEGDDCVNMLDFAEFAEHYLK